MITIALAKLKVLFSGRMILALVMGFASGLPLWLVLSVLQARLTKAGIALGTIGLFALVQLPYTWKFVWAPLLDRFSIPWLGRRRGWLVISQVALMATIVGLGLADPLVNMTVLAALAVAVALFSATQDIAVDAYRRETLSDNELGLGSSLYIYGYQLSKLLSAGGALILADRLPWATVYAIMAACMIPCAIATLLAPEPGRPPGTPTRLREAVLEPLREYFQRPEALWMLAFILLYKIGDTMAGAITTPFYLKLGFTMTQIGTVVKIFGTGAIIGGALAGGGIMLWLGIRRSLWVFGVLQAASTACFALLIPAGPQTWALAGVIAFENVSAGMGTAAFVAFMASITDKRFTATQYALLSSLMAIPRVLASAPTGYLANWLGWGPFFIACALIAAPGMALLPRFAPWNKNA